MGADHLAERISDTVYLERLAALRAGAQAAAAPRPASIDGEKAVARIRAMVTTWPRLTDREKADVAHAIYARVDVLGRSILGAELTPAAYAIALDQALPEFVRLEWRPRQVLGTGTPTLVRIPIAGRDEWLAAATRSA
jgi:hypothetical protein